MSKIERIKHLPMLLIAIGALWLGVLTFSNMMYTYYGWLPFFLDHLEPTWEKDEVSRLLVKFGTKARDRVASQVLPLGLIFIGMGASLIQRRRSAMADDRPG